MVHMKKGRKIMGFQWSKDLDLLMFMKEKSREPMGWAEVKIWISLGNKKKKRWVWAEVKIWNHMMLYMKRGRKIMGLGRSKDLDLLMCYKGKWQRNHGLSWSKDLDFNSE